MSLEIIALIPIESKFVPYFLERIIDKKIARCSLNILEKLIDYLCKWLYSPYCYLYQAKSNRIHTFSDGRTRLIDHTKQGIVRIDKDPRNRLDYIAIHDMKVLFTPNPSIDFQFSKKSSTDYVVIAEDEKRGPGWFKIVEQELPRPQHKPMEKCWILNSNYMYRFKESPSELFLLTEQK